MREHMEADWSYLSTACMRSWFVSSLFSKQKKFNLVWIVPFNVILNSKWSFVKTETVYYYILSKSKNKRGYKK